MTKKIKSKLDPFAERLEEWFDSGMTLSDAQKQLALDGCVISVSRLGSWWSSRLQERLQERFLNSVASGARFCQEVEAKLEEYPAPDPKTLIATVRTLALKLTAAANADPENIKLLSLLMGQILDWQRLEAKKVDQSLDERRVKILEQKAALAEQAEQVTKSELSPEEKQLKMREIFGLK